MMTKWISKTINDIIPHNVTWTYSPVSSVTLFLVLALYLPEVIIW